MNERPLFWVRQIHSTLRRAGEIPLLGFPPPFPWDECGLKLGALLQHAPLKITARRTHFLPAAEVTSGMGNGYVPIAIEMPPLQGQLHFVMPKEEIVKLTSLALTTSTGSKGFTSYKFQEGFYHFLCLKALEAIDELKAFKDLSLVMSAPLPLPTEDALCIDIAIEQGKQTLWARLICPSSLQEAFRSYFSTEPISLHALSPAKDLPVSIQLQAGETTLSLDQWNEVRVGDCILLDRCTYDVSTGKGALTLCLHGTPLLRARVKEGTLKIVDYAYYHEEQAVMTPDEEEPDEILPSDLDEDLSPGDESHLWTTPNGDTPTEKMISTQKIPLTLTVEIARLHMNLDKLLELQPGNVVELPVKPEQGVDVTIGGRVVAKAELIKLGDVLGVKILQIGQAT
ncbi:MAG: type III secretion system cytoplasmic ring protein SctQ [Verrucomicrobia bacterium]|nr:type III secretion system cytoplasmic ring protein SctQ [Verrucomicrobiota bacterium]